MAPANAGPIPGRVSNNDAEAEFRSIKSLVCTEERAGTYSPAATGSPVGAIILIGALSFYRAKSTVAASTAAIVAATSAVKARFRAVNSGM